MANETCRFPSRPEDKGWETVCAHVYTCLCVCVCRSRARICMCYLCIVSKYLSSACYISNAPWGAGKNQEQDRVFLSHGTHTGPCMCVQVGMQFLFLPQAELPSAHSGLQPGLMLLCNHPRNHSPGRFEPVTAAPTSPPTPCCGPREAPHVLFSAALESLNNHPTLNQTWFLLPSLAA